MKIAIGLTTHNRYGLFKESLKNIKKFLPKDAKLVIVDDGSDKPLKEATFRFETAQGIAVAKNKCLELMGDADYYMLFDDDCSPKVKDWHLPYINSGMNHLCFTFDRLANGVQNGRYLIKTENGISYYKSPCGLMLFITKACLDRVGGMDKEYGCWGFEHCQLSMRIFNAGLTHYPFMDVVNSLELFHSEDYSNPKAERSVSADERSRCISVNEVKYKAELKSSAYKAYKPLKSVVITTYFTGITDPQRGVNFPCDKSRFMELINSCVANNSNMEVVVLTDCQDDNNGMLTYFKDSFIKNVKIRIVTTECNINPYFQRWLSIKTYLEANTDIDQVFCVDATDVVMQINPFDKIDPGYLYVGSEPDIVNNRWMKIHHEPFYAPNVYERFGQEKLLNAGIVGGFRVEIMAYLENMCALVYLLQSTTYGDNQMTDMYIHNHVCYFSVKKQNIRTGRQLHTEFKAYENQSPPFSWFKHK